MYKKIISALIPISLINCSNGPELTRKPDKLLNVVTSLTDLQKIILGYLTFEEENCQRLEVADGAVYGVAYSSDGKLLATGANDKKIKLWDVKTGKCIKILNDTTYIHAVAFSPNGKLLASSGGDEQIRIWDIETGTCLNNWLSPWYTLPIVSFESNNKLFAWGRCGGRRMLIDLVSSKVSYVNVEKGNSCCPAYSPDGKFLASPNYDDNKRKIEIWNLTTQECIKILTPEHTGSVNTMCFSHDSKQLATCSNYSIQIWDLISGKLIKNFDVGAFTVAFSPDDTYLAVSVMNDVMLWRNLAKEIELADVK